MDVSTLDKLKEQLLGCSNCMKMVQSRKEIMGDNHYPIPPAYTENSFIMLIGIAPGRLQFNRSETDKDEYAFKMGSGAILDRAFSELGIDKKFMYVTNIVKCTTPSDGNFSSDDVKCCIDNYLRNEIKLVSPVLIIILGKQAQNYFDKYISDTDGAYTVGYLYHPAAVSRGFISYKKFKSRLQGILGI